MNEVKATTTHSVRRTGQDPTPFLNRQSHSLVLDLPDQPMGREDPANPDAFTSIFSIPVANGVHESFV